MVQQTKIGAKIWNDRDDKIEKIPRFLEHSYHIQHPKKDAINSDWSVEVHGPSTIYLAETNTKHETDMIKRGWKKEADEVIISCCKLGQIWKKRMKNQNLNTVNLPKMGPEEAPRIVFIKGNNQEHY